MANDTRDPILKADEHGTPYIEVAGVRVEVASPEECEQAAFVVCSPIGFFDDDIKTTCAFCNTAIVHRPSAPKAPPKICICCAISSRES